MHTALNRRDWLRAIGAAGLAPSFSRLALAQAPQQRSVKRVAAIITEYRHNSHADVILTKILEGWKHDGGPGPALELASMYVDQFPAEDMARPMSAKHGVPIFDTIEDAITLKGNGVAVDGVLCIGEHGDYPWNDKEQHLYPRRRFFEGITDTFQKYNRVVPVFHDKHPGPVWEDAKWMYDRAAELRVPFMAGSSLPVSFRKPDFAVPMGSEIEAAVGVGYSGLDIYGFHTLDCFQAMVERRGGAERGVKWVQCFEGADVWKQVDAGVVRKDVLDAALAVVPKTAGATDVRTAAGPDAALFLFEYHDGLVGSVLMLTGYAEGISTAVKLKGVAQPQAAYYEERPEPRYPHFAYLLKGVERMFHTGRPSYPVERTLLAAGILDRALTSRYEGHRRLETPELAIRYQPVDYSYAPHIDLLAPHMS
jgi:hypothetical protein